jgi:hypothetical protein
MSRLIATCIVLSLAAAAPAPAQTVAPHPGAAASSRAAAPSRATAGLASNQFSAEQAAKAHCPGDAIVWANLGGSKAYHPSGDKYFGKTKHGAFMCQKEADQSGFHAAGSHASKTATKSTNAKATTK